MAVDDQPRLGCGRVADEVWATADHPATPHEQTCPYCQRVRKDLADLAEATDALTAHEDEDPAYTPGLQVKELVMQLVHLEVRRGQPLPLVTPRSLGEPVDLAISEQAVLDLVWRAADLLPGLRARHCAVHLHPADQVPGRPAIVALEVEVAVAAGTAIPALVERFRAQLSELVTTETGLTVRGITVTVEDLYDA